MAKIEIEDDRIYRNMPFSRICSGCGRLKSSIDKTCEAFPDGIPSDIWTGKNNHKKPVKGDMGLLFREITRDEVDVLLEEAARII